MTKGTAVWVLQDIVGEFAGEMNAFLFSASPCVAASPAGLSRFPRHDHRGRLAGSGPKASRRGVSY
jgi:hypothetical protein